MSEDPRPGRPGLVIAPAALTGPDARTLIAELDAELGERYPDPADNHLTLAEDDVRAGDGVFLIAWLDGTPVGCGALRRLDDAALRPDTGEIKRMYVSPAARGNGVGGRILAELQQEARHLGLRHLALETGDRQPEALRVYERAGFRRIPRFGEYTDSPLSVCMGRPLTD